MHRLAVFAAIAVVLASGSQAPQTPVFRSSVDLVHLDVSVLDRNRRPVRGLTMDDFTVFEDDKPQRISVFSAVDVPEVVAPTASWMRTVPHEVQTNQGTQNADGRLFVLLIDDAMLPPMPAALKSAREIGRLFVDKITPFDRVAVVFSASGRNQNFTTDRSKLLAAIESLKIGHATHLNGWDTAINSRMPEQLGPQGPVTDPDIPMRSASMQTLRQVAETLISAPQRRKALIFVSAGIAIDDMSNAVPTMAGMNTRSGMKDANRQLARDLPELFRRMQRANVTIYPVDPCGLDGLRQYVAAAARATGTMSLQGEPPPLSPFYDWLAPTTPIPPRPEDLAAHMATLNLDFMETVAANTGGRAVINTNDFAAGVDNIFLENSSYYLLGYPQPSGLPPGSLHRIRVEVNRRDTTVRTRSGYAVGETPTRTKGKDLSPLDKAIVGAVAESDFPMRVALAPFVVPGKKDPVVTITLGLEQPAVAVRTSYEVQVQTNAYLTDGRPRFVGQRHDVNVVLVPRKGVDRAQYDLLSQISLAPGRYELRMSATRSRDGVRGSLYADVEIPDFAKDRLSVSGIVVQQDPPGATAPPSAFGRLLPVVPTSNREFRSNDAASIFFRVYQGGADPLAAATVDLRIFDEHDVEVGKGREVIPIDQFHAGGRSADYGFAIPLTALPPGRYLIAFEITLGEGAIARRTALTFAVRR